MKNKILVEIFLLILVIILLLFVLIFGLKGKNLFSKGELIFEETFDVKDLTLNVDVSSINIYSTNESKIKVIINGEKNDNVEVKNNEILEINYKIEHKFFNFSFFTNHNVDIYLPVGYENNVVVNSKTGSVNIEVPLKDVKINSVTGSIKLSKAENVKINSETGSIKLGNIENAEVEVETGSINIEEITNKANITSATGSIKITRANIKEDSVITAETGSIKIEDINDGLYIDASTKTGSVKNNAVSDRFSDITLKIETKTGSIKIK